jgi:hypothetical protein
MTLLEDQLGAAHIEHDGQRESEPVELTLAGDIWENIVYPVMVSQIDEAVEPQAMVKLTHDELEQAFRVETLREATRAMITNSNTEVATTGTTWQRITTAVGNDEDGYSLSSEARMQNGGVTITSYSMDTDGEENVTISFRLPQERSNARPDEQRLTAKLRLRDRGSRAAQAGGSFVLQVNRSGFPAEKAKNVTIVGRETPEGKLVGANVTVSSDIKPLSQITLPRRI